MVKLHRAFAVVVTMTLIATGFSSCADPVVDSPTPLTWDPRIEELARFVEKAHGDDFQHPVAVRFLSDTGFDRLAALTLGVQAKREPSWQDTALGAAHTSLAEEVEDDSDGTMLAGFYQPSSGALIVRGKTLNDGLRPIIAHELTHALQDQILSFPDRRTLNLDRELATTAVYEGDARRVEAAWVRSHPTATTTSKPAEDPREIEKLLNIKGIAAIHWWRRLMPYAHGWRYVEEVVKRGGHAALIETLKAAEDLRITTLDILMMRPGRFVAPPDRSNVFDGSEGDTGPIGGFRWYALLTAMGIDPEVALSGIASATTSTTNGCMTEKWKETQPGSSGAPIVQLALWMTAQNMSVIRNSSTEISMSWCRNKAVPGASPTIAQLAESLTQANTDAYNRGR